MVRNVGVNFNGRNLVRPGARSRIDASDIAVTGSGAEKKIAILGQAEGGIPGEYVEYSTYSEARNNFRKGKLLEGAQLAWREGAGPIGFIRMNEGSQASLTQGSMTLTSKMHASEANRIEAKLEDGNLEGSKRLTVGFWVDNIREVYDNIGPLFSVTHTGSNETATLSITKGTDGYAETVELTVGALEPLRFSVGDGGQFKEVNRLIAEIDSHPDIDAKLLGSYNKNIATKHLDAMASTDLIGTPATVTAFKGDLLTQVANSRVVDVAIDGDTLPDNFGNTFLTGGADGDEPTSYASALDALVGTGAYIIVPMTSDPVIQGEIASFIAQQTAIEQNAMRAFYGGALGETVDQILNRASSLNSDRSVVCYPGLVQSFDGQNEPALKPSYYTACVVAGRVAGLEMGEPATFKNVQMLDTERPLSTNELDRLVAGGVTVIEKVRSRNRSGFRIAQCITTYRDELNPAFREESINEMIDFLTAQLKDSLEDRFVGTRGTAFTPSVIKNAVQSFLDQKVRDEWLVEYQPESVVVEMEGEVVYVSYSAMPAHSINYILITSKFYKTSIRA